MPVINENDTVATTEIRYGDNDRLAARVATMMSADLLMLLSDVDGLYDAPPHLDAPGSSAGARITAEIEAMAGEAASDHARGGMRPRSTPARSPPRPARAWSSPPATSINPLPRSKGRARTWFLRPAIR